MTNRRVMIVEDESLVAEDLQMCLAKSGYDVVGIADSAESARRLASEASPDLVLLDIRLKGEQDGIDVAEHLRRERIGFVYLTSHADGPTLARARTTEPLGYVLKPFDLREMVPVLEMAFYRHGAERRLRDMEAWLQLTLRSIGDGVLVTDADRRITYLNPVAERLTGYSRHDALGLPVGDVMHLVRAATALPVACVVERAIRCEATIHLDPDVDLVARDGKRIPVDDCAAPIRADDGSITGAVVVIRDATEQRQVQQQQRAADQRLQEARRLHSLGVLAGGLAHDLNNMLTAILGNVSLCRDVAPPVLRHWLDEIDGHAHAAADLCRGLLAGVGAGPLVRQAVHVGEVVAACVARERAQAPDGIAFDVREEPQPVFAFADRVQLGQVVGNLLRNAVEALAARRGTVSVRFGAMERAEDAAPGGTRPQHPPGRQVWIDVADDGPGMPADVRARLFEPFFTTKFTGRGLGLASAHGIVCHHGGTIEVDSEPGQGTLFRVVWPAAPAVAAGEPGRVATTPPPAPAPSRTICVVDDDPAVRQVIARLLRSRGCDCHVAGSGDELLAMLRQGLQVDAVVLDAMMPGRTGSQTLADLRLDHPALPVVLVSGHLDLAECASVGGVDFLSKPFTVDELLARLETLLRPGRPS